MYVMYACILYITGKGVSYPFFLPLVQFLPSLIVILFDPPIINLLGQTIHLYASHPHPSLSLFLTMAQYLCL